MMHRKALIFSAVALGLLFSGGCRNKFWDPTQIGRFRPVPVQHVILDSLGLAEEEPERFVQPEPPKPEDVVTYMDDYSLHPGDVVRVNIYELLQENSPYIEDLTVSESGRISIPEIGVVEAEGYTEHELESELKQILSPDILKTPVVKVSLVSSDYRSFSILGTGLLSNVAGGRYLVPRGGDFRLLDALATAGGCNEFNVTNIYITRQLSEDEIAQRAETQYAPPGVEIPGVSYRSRREKKVEEEEIDFQKAEEELLRLIAPAELPVLSFAEGDGSSENIEWVFKNGRWVPVEKDASGEEKETEVVVGEQQEQTDTQSQDQQQTESDESVRDSLPEGYVEDQENPVRYMVRVIEVPWKALRKGDPRYNIVIKPGDVITVPSDRIGECVVMGNVNQPGYITLSGRPMTLMQAVAAAGGLGQLAEPENVEVRRRIGQDHEEIVMVNLDKIASGQQPDFYIKRDDTINVGTSDVSYWLYVLRNAFTANYGFSFDYSRIYRTGEYDYDYNYNR
ncbi:polysaccharide biosynthesis/export family protein [Sedimentisphaera salicampi]|nr:polysaccharide biosynthesis/export family protein [Sedimentisphaera salicampi]